MGLWGENIVVRNGEVKTRIRLMRFLWWERAWGERSDEDLKCDAGFRHNCVLQAVAYYCARCTLGPWQCAFLQREDTQFLARALPPWRFPRTKQEKVALIPIWCYKTSGTKMQNRRMACTLE